MNRRGLLKLLLAAIVAAPLSIAKQNPKSIFVRVIDVRNNKARFSYDPDGNGYIHVYVTLSDFRDVLVKYPRAEIVVC